MSTTDLATPLGRVLRATAEMERAGGPVPAGQLARLTACSTRQLQRDFARVLDVTPRQYGASLRSGAGRRALRSAPTVLDAVNDAGYGSVRAFYEETARRLGMTPAEYAQGAPHQVLVWSLTATEVGDVIAVASQAGLCAVRIGEPGELVPGIAVEFAGADLVQDDAAMTDVMSALRQLAAGLAAPRLPVAVVATAFQARVWAALRTIPAGDTRTYADVAAAIGSPTAVRAVARACAANPVALAVPCHRVIRSDGSPADYRWGLAVKKALLDVERAVVHMQDPSEA